MEDKRVCREFLMLHIWETWIVTIFLLHRWPDVYLGLTTMGQNMSIPSLHRALSYALAANPSSSTSSSVQGSHQPVVTAELMVHPGYPSHPKEGGCGEGPDDFSQSADRQHELSVLKDPSVLALYCQERVQLCAFRDLWLPSASKCCPVTTDVCSNTTLCCPTNWDWSN